MDSERKRTVGTQIFLNLRTSFARLIVSIVLVATASCAVHRDAAPDRASVSQLQEVCRPDVVQAIAASLSSTKVTVQQNPIDPKFPSGTQFIAATGILPAFCQVT